MLILVGERTSINNLCQIGNQYQQPKLLGISSSEQITRAITKWVYWCRLKRA